MELLERNTTSDQAEGAQVDFHADVQLHAFLQPKEETL